MDCKNIAPAIKKNVGTENYIFLLVFYFEVQIILGFCYKMHTTINETHFYF